jgi:formylglycine-generating enzyme required for sulfatase activity/tRNA A-37 threonylcarbamoyl transferase component Bud32
MSPPKKLGKYEIHGELGRGGFATVYKARDPNLNRTVALKVLHSYWSNDLSFAARFQREAQAAAGLHHPHIVPVYEADEVEGQLYIAMAYLPGHTLRDLLAAEGPLSLERALPILSQVAEALDYAHERGVIHRDVKPANIMVQERGQKAHATLLDFGLVKAMEQSTVLTSQGTLLGSPEYMAPEQADPERAAEIGPAADRYALGVVAYHMLAGRVPFPGNTPGTLNAHEHKPVPPPRSLRPELPEPAAHALLKMLAKAPADRYPSACAFVEQLDRAWQAERQARQHEAQLSPVYRQLQAAFERKDWAQVLELGGQIRAVDPDYRDVAGRMAHARQQLQRSQRFPVPDTLRQVPRWAWGLGMAGVVVLLGLLCLGLWSLGPGLFGSTPSPTGVAELATATAANPSPTLPPDIPTTAPIFTPVPPAPTSTLTETPGPTDTATPTSTPQPPTSMPTSTPQPPTPAPTPGLGATKTRSTDGMTMVYVPAGTFQMGSDERDPNAADDEKPPHPVSVDAFWIDKYEVTNEQFARFVQATGYRTDAEKAGTGWALSEGVWKEIAGAGWQHPSGPETSISDLMDHPVVQVSWNDAQAYCAWAGGRLPSEGEWEYAARGADSPIYPWGDTFDGQRTNFCGANCTLDWKNENYNDGYERTAPVGSFSGGASWVGALDMAGNVWEWVNDWYGNYPSEPQVNPTGPSSGEFRVLRGGSWDSNEESVRAAARNSIQPDARLGPIGFRCVVEPGS